MTKDTLGPKVDTLDLLMSMVTDHGDAFRFSMSKKGRVWLTLTHWDSEKYNTSVELDPMAEPKDMLDALAVLLVAHSFKCFGSVAHDDTWLAVDAGRNAVIDSVSYLASHTLAGKALDDQAAPE